MKQYKNPRTNYITIQSNNSVLSTSGPTKVKIQNSGETLGNQLYII